jgi:hypothetical protein
MTVRRLLPAVSALAAGLLIAGAASAHWTAAGTGAGSASTGTLAPPTGVAATATGNGTTVRVTWTAPTAPGGGPVTGHVVERLTGSTVTAACGTSSSNPLPGSAVGCDDTALASGTYTYRVTAVFRTWTAPSVPSPPVTVSADAVPTVTGIVRADAPATQTGNGNLRWTVTFSEPVTGVDAADFRLVAGGLGGSPTITSVTGSGAGYTVSAGTGTGSGTLRLDLLDDDTVRDAAGNALGGAGTTGAGDGSATGQAYTLDRTIASVTLVNGGGTAGQIEQGDRIVIRFSRDMDPTSFCDTWIEVAGTFVDIAGNNEVTVTVTDGGAGNDTLTVSATPCLSGFKFGTIDLGSPGYLTGSPSAKFAGTETFSGAGAKKSTISWDPVTFTLTVELGQASARTGFGTVASSAPVYTADPAIRDRSGGAVTNSPFPLPAGRQF